MIACIADNIYTHLSRLIFSRPCSPIPPCMNWYTQCDVIMNLSLYQSDPSREATSLIDTLSSEKNQKLKARRNRTALLAPLGLGELGEQRSPLLRWE